MPRPSPAKTMSSAPRTVAHRLKQWLKRFPLLVKIKRCIWGVFPVRRHGSTRLNIVTAFPSYRYISTPSYRERAHLTIQAINRVLPSLFQLVKNVNDGGGVRGVASQDLVDFPRTDDDRSSARRLKELFDSYGSDKASSHQYHHLYGTILGESERVEKILEMGIGWHEAAGASLYAFRDYCPNARVYGCDNNRGVLFQDERIETHHLDQLDPVTFDHLLAILPRDFDLVIDDGLHALHSQLAALDFGLKIVRRGGWVVIEDILSKSIDLWRIVAHTLPEHYRTHILLSDPHEDEMVFAVQRLD